MNPAGFNSWLLSNVGVHLFNRQIALDQATNLTTIDLAVDQAARAGRQFRSRRFQRDDQFDRTIPKIGEPFDKQQPAPLSRATYSATRSTSCS